MGRCIFDRLLKTTECKGAGGLVVKNLKGLIVGRQFFFLIVGQTPLNIEDGGDCAGRETKKIKKEKPNVSLGFKRLCRIEMNNEREFTL